MSIVAALTEIQELMEGLSGVRSVPANPPDDIPFDPVVLVYAAYGNVRQKTFDDTLGLHVIVIDVLVANTDIGRVRALLNPFIDSVPAALYSARKAGTFNTIETFGGGVGDGDRGIDYEFVTVEYGGQGFLGYRFTVNDVKITTLIA